MARTASPLTAGYRLEIPAYLHVERCWPEIDKYSPGEGEGNRKIIDSPVVIEWLKR